VIRTTNQMLREIERVLANVPECPAARSAAYERELVNRYLTGQSLTTADKREARLIIRRNSR
jgi:hypothetical protein